LVADIDLPIVFLGEAINMYLCAGIQQ